MGIDGPELVSDTVLETGSQYQTTEGSGGSEDEPCFRTEPTRYDPETARSVIALTSAGPLHSSIYVPLKSSTNFRLLCLARTSASSDLEGKLLEQTIGDALPYDCLSYVWGNPAFQDFINLSGVRFPITPTLDCALRGIRGRINDDVPFALLWVDAICINQLDLLERNQQVGRMCDIYRNAEQVIAHLGDEADGSEHLPQLFGEILFQMKETPQTNAGNDFNFTVVHGQIGVDDYEKFGLRSTDDEIWGHFSSFLVRPWFSRAWIVQEALLSRHLIFMCGTWALPEFLLQQVAIKVGRHLLSSLSSLDSSRNAIEHFALRSSLRQQQEPMKRIRLIDLLDVVGPVNATEPRDYLNAFFGLSIEAEESELQPRYDQPVEETFGSFARYGVKNGQGIKILYTACKC